MLLHNLDGGIHNSDDLNQKFANTYVYGQIKDLSEKDEVLYIRYIHGLNNVEVRRLNHENHLITSVVDFDLKLDRPKPTLFTYNIPNRMPRPLRLSWLPRRQWRRGVCDENCAFEDVKGMWYDVDSIAKGTFSRLEEAFNPTFLSMKEAIDMLMEKKAKHLPISNKVSIMRGKSRLIMLRNFVPFLAYANGMSFAVSPVDQFLKEESEKYSTILTNYVGSTKLI